MTETNLINHLPKNMAAAFKNLGLGASQFGNMGQVVSDHDTHDTINYAWGQGIRYFDTAPHYGLGLSERRLGSALKSLPRSEYVLSTKVGRLLRPNPHPKGSDEDNGFLVPDDLTRVRDYTADGVYRSLEESLDRLGTDSVDILWIHDPEEPDDRFAEAMTGAVPALERLRDEGTIMAWGVGSKDPLMLKRFVDQANPDLIMLAGRYTLLEQENVGLMTACNDNRVGVVAVGVFNSGLLARDEPPADAKYEYGPVPQTVLEKSRKLAAVVREHGVSLPEAALAFPLRHPAVVNVIAGMRTPAHVERNLNLINTAVPEELWADLQLRGFLPEHD